MSDSKHTTQPPTPPDLILMAGYPGVGKSAIAMELARPLHYPLFDIDDILIEVKRTSGIEDWERRGYLAYSILQGLVAKQMQLGVSTIVDTPLTHQWLRDFMFDLRQTYDASIHVIYCHCSDAVAIRRNQMRLAENPQRYSGRDAENFHRIKGLYQPIETITSIRINTESPVTDSVRRILLYLDGARRKEDLDAIR